MDRGKVEIEGDSEPNQQSSGQISHLALDIGGSLIKLVYFSKDNNNSAANMTGNASSNGNSRTPVVDGQIHLKRFETSKINECIEFIHSRKLHLGGVQHHEAPTSDKIMIKATGGGAYMFADLFKEKLGIFLDKEDEMDCLVAGANFLLKAVHHEAFTYMDGRKEFVQIQHDDLYPYLLVNIGSGVSMIKVDGDGKFERVSGTSVGGGTFWGLGRLLTRCKSFDELLESSHRGNNKVVDMLVGDIYGGTNYSKIGLSATAIASSFGKTVSNDKELEDYNPEDISRSLLRMISNNIGQISYLNALQFGLKRIFFGGFFIRSQAYTMDTISVAVKYWSKGEAKAMFLQHEGFLGALGAFLSYEKWGLNHLKVHQSVQQTPTSASSTGDKKHNPQRGYLNDHESIQCSIHAAYEH